MHIKIYTHKLKVNIVDDIAKFKDYFKKHGIDLNISVEDTSVSKGDAPLKLFLPNDGKYDVVFYMYNNGDFQMDSFGLSFSISKTLRVVYLKTDKVNDDVGYTFKSMAHELMHCLFYKLTVEKGIKVEDPMDGMYVGGVWKTYYKNEELDALDGNFAEGFKRLNNYLKPMYKYFKENEVIGLNPKLVGMLDKAREIAGVPFKITSGFRTPEQNKLIGGVQDSAHESGLAVDLSIKDGTIGEKINSALHQVGFKRFGYYRDGHIHVDIDDSKPSPCYWIK